MDYKKINEFKVGDYIEGFFLIKDVFIKSSSNNKSFLDITLTDKTGEMNAKLWDCSKEDEELFTPSKLIKARGNVIEWQGRLQLKIMRLRLATEADGIKIEDYVLSAPEKAEDMYSEILKYIDRIKNSEINGIVSKIIEESKEKLMFYPAAKSNHHAIRCGLLYHVLTMLRSADRLSEVYTYLNKDLLFAGVILHDIAKLEEMDSSEIGIVSDYTIEGQLLGHIIQGIKRIEKVGEEVGASKEVMMLLQHMLLSHHYEPEFGSPKRPMIPEAELLHYLDIIDSRMFDMNKALDGVEKNNFSDKVWVLHNRKVYKTNITESKE